MTFSNPLRLLKKLVKRTKKKAKKENASTEEVSQEQVRKPLTFEEDLVRIRSSDEDVVSKMYEMDLALRHYLAKEYKLGKKLSYAEMIAQLHALQKPQAEEFIKRIIAYAYSGQPLDEGKMSTLLTMFQQLVETEEARKQAEKQAWQAARGRGKEKAELLQAGEPLAGKLRPLPAVPPLPPSEHPEFSFPNHPLNTLKEKLNTVVSTLRTLRVPPALTRVRLPHLRLRAAPAEKAVPLPRQPMPAPPLQHSHHEPPRPSFLHASWRIPRLYVHLPHLHAPKLRTLSKVRSRIREIHVPEAIKHPHLPHFHFPHLSLSRLNFHRLTFPTIHVPELHLPHIHLPQRTPHESHAPRVKLPSPVRSKQSAHLSSQLHLPHIHLPHLHPLKVLKRATTKVVRRLPHPNVGEYVNTLRERIHDIHPSDTIERVREHLPHLHLREYATEVKDKSTELWHRVHPVKKDEYAEEEEAEEIPVEETSPETAEETQETQEEMQEKQPLEEDVPQAPAPVPVEPERFWIEYKPRHHFAHLTHHVAFDIDDLHHLKPLIKPQKSGLL